jgi:vesicle coat complex subunit
MRRTTCLSLVGCLLACAGCGGGSTTHWIEQLKSPEPKTRLQAVRSLQRKEDAAQIVPALIEVLQDDFTDVRRTAAGTLGSFGAEATSAVPALTAALRDREPSVRKTAGLALKTIDPEAARKAGVK